MHENPQCHLQGTQAILHDSDSSNKHYIVNDLQQSHRFAFQNGQQICVF